MYLSQCQYCRHGNPVEAKFCSECGAPLHLTHCPKCGAVNQVTSTSCYQCHGALPGRRTGELIVPEADVATGPERAPAPPVRPRSRVPGLLIALVAVAMALPVYLIYRGVNPGGVSAAAPDTSLRPAPGGAGPIVRATQPAPVKAEPSPAPGDKPAAAERVEPGPSSAAPAPVVAPPAAPAISPKSEPVAAAKPAPPRAPPPRRPPPAAAPSNAPASGNAKPAQPSTPCTPAVAALGLCTP